MRIAMGADHAGFALEQRLATFINGLGHVVVDFGVFDDDEPVDYPAVCAAVGRAVQGGRCDRGVVLGGSGQGEQIAANKVPGVRAALCNDLYLAQLSRAHNDANVLAMGAFVVGVDLAAEIVETWLGTGFDGGRHRRRVAQIEVPPAWPAPPDPARAQVFAGAIRDMRRADLPTVLDVVAAHDPALRPIAKQEIGVAFTDGDAPGDHYIVAEQDGALVGVVGWTPDHHFGVPDVRWLVWGYVRPGWQRSGIGVALFDTAEARLAREGVRKIYLDVGNPATHGSAIAFHLKRGYAQEGRLPDFWSDGEDLLIFGKHVAGAGHP